MMPAHILWDRITRTATVRKERSEGEHRLRIMQLLMEARAISFNLQAAHDPPPSWDDLQRQKKNQGPKKEQVTKARKAYEEMAERHQEGLSSAYHFMIYMGMAAEDGRGQLFPKPAPATVKTSKEFRHQRKKQVADMLQRIDGKLDRFAEMHGGDTPIDQVLVGRQ